MKKFTIFIFVNTLSLFVIQFGIGMFMDRLYKNSSIFKTNIIFSKSFNIANKDILILGGSRGLTGLDSKYISEKTGKTVYNLSTDNTQMNVHLMQLKMMISRNIKPKILILDFLHIDGFSHNSLRFMPLIGDKDIDDYFRVNYGSTWVAAQKIFPLYKYVFYNDELLFPAFIIAKNPKYTYRSDVNGDYEYPELVNNVTQDTIIVKNFNASKTYEDLRQLCVNNHIKLVAIVQPYYKNIIQLPYPEVINFCALLNDKKELFYDEMHINGKGRYIYNKVVADTLNQIISKM